MTKSATSDNSSAVGLFPFLAVLLCTMGALLVLLVILAQRVGIDPVMASATSNEAVPAPSPEPAPLADPNEAITLRAELADVRAFQQELQRLETEGQQRLEDEQKRLSHLEDHVRRLEHDLAKLHLAVQQLEETESDQQVDQQQAEQELARLQELLTDTEEQLEELREQTAGRRSYSVVPYKGKNGTYAKPIYIVCDEEGITLLPEGVKLRQTDFISPDWAGNPLAAALRASREYLKQKAEASGHPEPHDPYPLILVRPGGTNLYRLVRAAITSWDARYGYEFIDSDWKLTFPELPDPRLAQIQQHAIENARRNFEQIARAAPRRFGGAGAIGSHGGGGGRGRSYGEGAQGDRYASVSSETGEGSGGSGLGDRYASANGELGGEFSDGISGSAGGDHAFSSFGPYGGQAPGADQGGSAGGDQLAGGPADGSAGGAGDASAGGNSQEGGAAGGAGGSSNTPGQYGQSGSASQSGAVSAVMQGMGQAGEQPGEQPGMAQGAPNAGDTITSGNSSRGTPGAEFDPDSQPMDFSKQQSIADARGSDWAIQQAMRSAIPISRPIQVVVRHNQIALLPSRHVSQRVESTGTVISLDQSMKEISNQFSDALQEHVEEWGVAGNGMYWRPVLELQVGPEATQTARRLQQLLKNSGVDVRMPQTAKSQRGQRGHGTR